MPGWADSVGKEHLVGRALAIAVAALSYAPPADAQDRVIGLLALPEVYGARHVRAVRAGTGAAACHCRTTHGDRFIRVDQNWSFAPHGGCEGLEVSVHHGQQRHQLPTLEYDYEMPAAIVLEQRSGWFRIRLA